MKIAPITILCLGFFSLNSCNRVGNEFVLSDKNNAVALAEVQLCGKHLLLNKFGSEFRGAMPISCEGEGNILLRLKDGSETTCRIGYVTPGAEETFTFVVEDGHCR